MPHKKRESKNHIQVKRILAESELSLLDKKKPKRSFERVPRHDYNPGDRKREQQILNEDSDDDKKTNNKKRSALKKHINKELQQPKESVIPKKSRKNKYYLLNHPELKGTIQTTPKPNKRKHEEVIEQENEPSPKKPAPEAKPSVCDKLVSHMVTSRFRYLNEKLYTTTSKEAQKMFEKDPQSFYAYHQGYAVSLISTTKKDTYLYLLFLDKYVKMARSAYR